MLWWISIAVPLIAGPVDFGMSELRSAMADRHVQIRVETEISLAPPESYEIVLYKAGGARISGGDLRGLMYGLLDAADQIRATGKLKSVTTAPSPAIRGVRKILTTEEVAQPGFPAFSSWHKSMEDLARQRVNRLVLVFPTIDVRLGDIRFLSQMANDYAIDFVLGFASPPESPGEMDAFLRMLLDHCPMVRGIELEANLSVAFYRDGVFKAIRETGRRVTLDLHSPEPELVEAASQAGMAWQDFSEFEK